MTKKYQQSQGLLGLYAAKQFQIQEDNVKAHLLQPDDTYVKADRRGKASVSSQDYFVREAKEKVKAESSAYTGRVFIPEEPVE